jgi:ankyrin repeat protein
VIHSAARWGTSEMVQILVNTYPQGINARDKGGMTPFVTAALNKYGGASMAKTLLDHKVDVESADEFGYTQLDN